MPLTLVAHPLRASSGEGTLGGAEGEEGVPDEESENERDHLERSERERKTGEYLTRRVRKSEITWGGMREREEGST